MSPGPMAERLVFRLSILIPTPGSKLHFNRLDGRTTCLFSIFWGGHIEKTSDSIQINSIRQSSKEELQTSQAYFINKY
jgi:hypothetical protein